MDKHGVYVTGPSTIITNNNGYKKGSPKQSPQRDYNTYSGTSVKVYSSGGHPSQPVHQGQGHQYHGHSQTLPTRSSKSSSSSGSSHHGQTVHRLPQPNIYRGSQTMRPASTGSTGSSSSSSSSHRRPDPPQYYSLQRGWRPHRKEHSPVKVEVTPSPHPIPVNLQISPHPHTYRTPPGFQVQDDVDYDNGFGEGYGDYDYPNSSMALQVIPESGDSASDRTPSPDTAGSETSWTSLDSASTLQAPNQPISIKPAVGSELHDRVLGNRENKPFMNMGSNMDESMKDFEENMRKMQRQMEENFRNMNMTSPFSPPPRFPPMMESPGFGTMPRFPDWGGDRMLPAPGPFPAILPMSPGNTSPGSVTGSSVGGSTSSSMANSEIIPGMITHGKDGKKQLKLQFDMKDFDPEDVQVRKDRNKLEVTAQHEEREPNKMSRRVVTQQYQFPKDVRLTKVDKHFGPDGLLTVESPVKPRHNVKFSMQNNLYHPIPGLQDSRQNHHHARFPDEEDQAFPIQNLVSEVEPARQHQHQSRQHSPESRGHRRNRHPQFPT